ncbi:MAG: hypothetical protein VX438_19515, partial [Planctomycetota bacterium]|nr:hypothetical protein [Planctomycetota bacterium]
NLTNFELGINRHRWFGIGATVLAIITTVIGWRARNEVMLVNRSGMWKFGVILTAALMGVVGHQGGEEVYGEGVYERAAEKLIPEYWPFASEDKENSKATENQNPKTDQESKPETSNQKTGDPASVNENPQQPPDNTPESEVQGTTPPTDPTLNRLKK